MAREHRYTATVEWTGNTGTGTSSYRAYERKYEIAAAGKPPILASSDPHFRGDATRYNPEDLLVASLSSCHMLWYLHLCAQAGIVVTRYVDAAEGVMIEESDGGGRFARVTLRPQITVQAGADLTRARTLHHDAHVKCFIANSVKFPVECEPAITTE
ncbi:OsmC family peroxiredoxin [bacterium]|nr:MAG: OsmC family peroxiredoxin [bacterium]